MYTLTIAQKAYSSWSMRGWLLLASFAVPFRERMVRMATPAFDAWTEEAAPARTVPHLAWEEGGRLLRVWDSLAIAETLAERHPDAGIWPADPAHRAVARSLAAEMHSGLMTLRGSCPMNLHRSGRPLANVPRELADELKRLADLWDYALVETGGPWLGGPEFSAADAFFAPVATRLESYALMDARTGDYAMRLMAHPQVAAWIEAGRADPERLERYESID